MRERPGRSATSSPTVRSSSGVPGGENTFGLWLMAKRVGVGVLRVDQFGISESSVFNTLKLCPRCASAELTLIKRTALQVGFVVG